MDDNKPLLRYRKRADKTNRVIIPKFWIENNGRNYIMQVFCKKIVLIPIEEEEK